MDGSSKDDIGRDRPCEQERILQHDAHMLTQQLFGHLPHIAAVHRDPAFIHIIEAEEQIQDRAFA